MSGEPPKQQEVVVSRGVKAIETTPGLAQLNIIAQSFSYLHCLTQSPKQHNLAVPKLIVEDKVVTGFLNLPRQMSNKGLVKFTHGRFPLVLNELD